MTDERDATPPGPGGDLEPTRTNIRAAARLSPGDGVGDRYTIVGRLGLGGMGEVYRARDEELGVEVALKVLRPEYAGDRTLLERFRREILLARQVTHGNVVRIHDLGKEGELVFLTMDLVEGRSLRQLLEEKGRFSADETAEIGRQLAEALAAAHAKGVVHRDLKPSNVMIDADGNAYVTDFGVARSITAPDLTRTGLVVGTPEYLSPEQVRGEDLDGRSDLYALGVLLFELLAGKPPTQGQTADEVVAQHLQGVPRRLAGLPEETPANLKAILRRCLEPDRRRRYADGAELARDLADLSRPRPRWPGWSGRGRLALWAGVGLALVAAALLLRPDRDAGAPGDRPAAALVVLPFADETGRPELAWLGPGVPELLFEALVGEPELRVVSPQRSLQAASDLKLAPGSLSESAVALAAEIFDSSRLLTGSVRSRADGGLRIDARLVDPAVGLDGAAFLHAEAPAGPDSARQVIADLQGELAASLRLGRRAREEAPLSSPALPQYSEAVRKLWEGDALGARDQLQEAVQADPGFGAAWLRLGQAYEANGQYDQALDATDRAVETLPQGPAGGGRLRLLARAQQARLAGEPERAQEILAQLVADYPG
ncbi:MAG: protein kinase, partial [Thermoanaerobaculia bacterium]|nr:protein kinase [Thermoanaerobaculia bacterium]